MRLNVSHPVAVLIGLLLLGATSAQAATNTYTFSGTLDSGVFNGETFSGQFSFDDAALTGMGDEYLTVNSVNLNFHSQTYTQANAAINTAAEVAFLDGTFLGLSFTVESADPKFSFIAGATDLIEASFAYVPGAGISGFGSVTYTQMPVPEPETYAMLLAGLGLVGWSARRNRSLTLTRKTA